MLALRQRQRVYIPSSKSWIETTPPHTLYAQEFSRAIFTACWCLQGTLFKIPCKHLHAIDFKINPLRRNPNVKFHLCKDDPAHSDFLPKWPGFQGSVKVSKTWGQQPITLPLSTKKREDLPWQVSQHTHQVHPERRGQFPVIVEKQSHGQAWGLPIFNPYPQSPSPTWPQGGESWPDAFRRAQRDPDCSVKSP